jgi:hypothetical protein
VEGWGMSGCSVFASRAAAEGATLATEVGAIRTEGYHAAGDGGGAFYLRVAARPAHAGRLATADGSWWEIAGPDFSARQFGAHGDGRHDDSAALQAALDCPLVSSLRLPPGQYRAMGLKLRRRCALSGEATLLFWDEPEPEGSLLTIMAQGAVVSSLTFKGVRYQDVDSPVGPRTLLAIDPRQAEDAGEVRLSDLTFIGGQTGCSIGLVSNIFIDRVRFERCRNYALVLIRGPRKIVINGLIASEIGSYGGLKTDFAHTSRATERLVINDFVITDCGRIERDPDFWQEGLDFIAGFAREFVVSNGVISNCGNGGIELKTSGGLMLEEDDTYQDLLITNVVISTRGNAHGIVLNWHGVKTNRDKRGRRIMIANNIIRHEGVTTTAGSGIHVSAWSDLHIVNNFIEGAYQGVVLAPVGASDNTAANVRIAGNQILGVQTGVSARKGYVEDLDISGNVIDCARSGVALVGSSCRGVTIAHNHLRQRGAQEHILACIDVRNARDVEIWSNKLDSAEGHGVYVHDDTNGASSGAILKNVVRARRESFVIRGGDWQLFENFIRARPATRTLRVGKGARAAAAWNIRGLRPTRPLEPGSPGDVVLHGQGSSDSSPAVPGWWVDMSEDDGRGSWVMIAATPEPEAMSVLDALARWAGRSPLVAKVLRSRRKIRKAVARQTQRLHERWRSP